ncbi:hypothetical protein, conserved in T. vivax [Trypanosoma vivax Y486]|uniref:Trypanosome variant surface glycoprotein A-type N-terminal domain-containing protein n=1 Tax=Trypanosoma vivax (strain Y486) TaxID=1055687 RepID=F9WP46_TRYVY|nr:hypothetical protein, conserved in T. vivax [Trypanosoma vivax Y486]|eukprot:CCD19320.1 hypothetical protein, conserved in T. vivax [Trypanosoma vivax Y486]
MAAEFCADVEREARRLRDASREITAKHRHMAGGIDGMIGTIATHNRGKSGQDGVACIGDGSASSASAIKSTLAGYRQTQLKACFTANAEEMDTAKFEAQLKTHATALTLVDGSSDTSAIVANPGGAETYCAFFTGKETTNAVLYSTGSGDTDVAATWGGMWQIAKTGNGQNVKLHATGQDSRTLASWAAQEDIAETLKTLKEIAAAISASNKTHAAANCLHQLAKGTATLQDVALREACSAFAFDALAREVDNKGSRARRRVAPQTKGPNCQHRDRTKVTMKQRQAHARTATEASRRIQERKAAQPKQQALLHRVCSRRRWDFCARPRDETRMGGGERT